MSAPPGTPATASFDWRAWYPLPPDVSLAVPDGLVCPLDDVVLQRLQHDVVHCPTCGGAWNAGGRHGRWLPRGRRS